MKTKHSALVVKSAKVLHKEALDAKRLPLGFAKPEDGDWVCMSAEIPPEDEAGNDVVRVAGLGTGRHTDKSPIKLLGNHLRSTDSGPAIIGRMEEFKLGKTAWKGKSVPALFGRFSWAKDGEGTITDLAGKYKALWDGGYLDSVSIGFRPIKSRALNAEKPWDGYEYIESELVELSIVTIPANPAATVLRAIADTFDAPKAKAETKELSIDVNIADADAVVKTLGDADSRLTTSLKRFESLLDDMECAISVARPEDAKQDGDHSTSQAPAIDFGKVQSALDSLKSLLPTK